ncbi:NADP-dependent oxidoreductase [Yinghuangia sp. ASG 101]|uniref:NADP-dependent oxidoreductase n=1 Tax=Yinghuangia sp. ASG 101 TaxID=2896848 RepID=UPI001E641EB7|nr:NADP-dependent oxidoreductase [Yinghuangia sp. ASG 101]UGQ11098.1 NADP-dependent oxidoreductase [Yinghuangia sp. ASG 101]
MDRTIPSTQRRVTLAARPEGAPRLSDFAVRVGPVPTPADGEVLVRTVYLSLDPYLRGRMGSSAAHSSATPAVPLGGVMEGGTVGEVALSAAAGFAPGDLVTGNSGWQEYAVQPAAALRRLDPAAAPVSTALGILGMPGLTGWAGLVEIGRPRPGETVVVAAATGVVGSVVGQLARRRGARAVGIAGGPDKVAWLRAAGFDAAIDHRAPDFAGQLAAATPDGIDVYVENVGGRVWDAVWPRLNRHARVPVCGVASAYSATGRGTGDMSALLSHLVTRSITMRGFAFHEFAHLRPQFEAEVAAGLRAGELVHHEEVVTGLDRAPAAFLGMLAGEHLGKRLVRVGADPTR